MKRKIVSILIILGLLVGLTAIPAAAQPTQEEVQQAINDGVAWLLTQQNPDGSWGHCEPVAVTAFAVKKLEHHAVDTKWGLGLDSPFDAEYADDLQAGLNFLFANAHVIAIDTQTYDGRIDDPDTDSDDNGVYFGIRIRTRTYTTGIALMAIAESTTPDRVVDVPGSEVDGWTYEEVAQDTVDYLAWGQTDSGIGRGGWTYDEMDDAGPESDQSNTGYAVLGLQYAEASPPEGFALTIPPFVKTELEIWVDYIQQDDGGSDYYNWDISNILRTGNLLKELAFIGATKDDDRVQAALGYLHLTWDELGEPGWRGWSGGVANYQATYTTMKGLTSLNIHEFCDPPIDWQADFETVLVEQQNTEDPEDPLYGSWPQTTFWDVDPPILSTLWALLTLQKVAPPPAEIEVPVDIKPQSCPNPLNVESKSVLPVAILGTEEFDVTTVDPALVLLEGVAPLRWAMEDVATPFEPFTGKEACDDCTTEGADGYLDLTFKFDKQAIVDALGEVEDGECVVLHLTGNLKDESGGTAIVGEDVVRILKKGKGKNK